MAQEMGCRFVETSAKLGTNVTQTFIDLVRDIRDRNRVGCSELGFCHLVMGGSDDPLFFCIWHPAHIFRS
jgi:Ras family